MCMCTVHESTGRMWSCTVHESTDWVWSCIIYESTDWMCRHTIHASTDWIGCGVPFMNPQTGCEDDIEASVLNTIHKSTGLM